MRTARAAVCEAPNTPFVIRDYPLRPVQPREVLVRVKMSTICRSDIHSYEGRRPNPFPGILGHEIIGTIEELGQGIERDMRGDRLQRGDRITWSEYFFDGDCYYSEIHDMPQKDANMLVRTWISLRGIHNYHPRHLVQALDFVRSNRHRIPFHQIVDSKFSLLQLDLAFKKAAQRMVLRAAIVP